MEKGRIVRFYGDRGFGFIKPERGNDIFFHVSDLTNYAPDTELEGKKVAYDSVDSMRGKKTLNVILIP